MKKFIGKLEYLLDMRGIKKDIILLAISGIALVLSFFDIPHIAWVAIILCGVPIILEAILGLITAFDIKADVLVSIALVASICIGEDFAAGEIAFIMQLGALLEELTVSRARAGIEKLVHLTPRTARVISSGEERIVPAEDVDVDDILRVLPGEVIPVDGIITSGETSINQAVMTGESLPVDKAVGDTVSSGTVNQFGSFEMRATKVGEDSSIQRMIKLVQSADAKKAKIVGIADRWATWIVIGALSAALLAWIFTGEAIRGVTVLVVFCPCSLVLATPTAIMAAIGNATKHGFLVKEGDALEKLANVSRITFDKTGTLTYGIPRVIKVKSISNDTDDSSLYRIVASVEQFSEHPLGRAIVKCYKDSNGASLLPVDDFRMVAGRGISGRIEGKYVLAGNKEMLLDSGIDTNLIADAVSEYLYKGATAIYIAIDKELVGYIVLSDTIRPESKDMIDTLKRIGAVPVLLTGDNVRSAGAISKELGIKEMYAESLPEDKLRWIESYQKRGNKVCMIGDGINDAPALKIADVGIAMGGVGSDIAVDAADIALVDDDIKELPHLVALSKRMMVTIKINMTFSMTLNFVAIILAIIGTLNPVIGALVHNAGSVLVIVNSALLLKWKRRGI